MSGIEHLALKNIGLVVDGAVRVIRFAAMSKCGPVLVVEDDADVRSSARIALTSFADKVELLSSADTLDAALAAASYEVVLLDMNFVTGERTGAAGLSSLARIQAFDPTLAVVLMTAYGGVSLAVEALERAAIERALTRHEGNISSAALALGLSRAALYRRMSKYGL